MEQNILPRYNFVWWKHRLFLTFKFSLFIYFSIRTFRYLIKVNRWNTIEYCSIGNFPTFVCASLTQFKPISKVNSTFIPSDCIWLPWKIKLIQLFTVKALLIEQAYWANQSNWFLGIFFLFVPNLSFFGFTQNFIYFTQTLKYFSELKLCSIVWLILWFGIA